MINIMASGWMGCVSRKDLSGENAAPIAVPLTC